MESKNKVTSKIIETEISIKLLEYLKRKNIMDDGVYIYIVNKLIKKHEVEKNRINDDYINDIKNYKILT